MRIDYNEFEVSWVYNNNNIKYVSEGIQFATESNGLIYIELFNDNIYERQYVTFEGDLILSHNVDNGEIKISTQGGQLKTIKIPSLKSVSLSNNQKIYILSGEGPSSRLREYTLEGILLKDLSPPQGYSFYRLGQMDEGINVVCRGYQDKADQYGRNDWNFYFDVQKGEWIKESLAY